MFCIMWKRDSGVFIWHGDKNQFQKQGDFVLKHIFLHSIAIPFTYFCISNSIDYCCGALSSQCWHGRISFLCKLQQSWLRCINFVQGINKNLQTGKRRTSWLKDAENFTKIILFSVLNCNLYEKVIGENSIENILLDHSKI